MNKAIVLKALEEIIGGQNLLTEQDAMQPFLREWRGLFEGRAAAVARPKTAAEVSSAMRFLHESRTPVIPQGGNTGLVGGQTPVGIEDAVIMSLTRMDRIRDLDPIGNVMIVEAGVTLAKAREAASQSARIFPLSLASEGSCTIGGNLATNAGGVMTLAYGNARDLALGLEVVLADGRILNGLSRLRKDNTGYDLKNLFIGSEGSLGIITAASLKLFPQPASIATAFCGLQSPDHALALLETARGFAGAGLTAFELAPRIGIDMVVKHITGARDPLAHPHAWYVLVELSSSTIDSAERLLLSLLATAAEQRIVQDAVVATSGTQAAAFWRLRESFSEAQKHEGGSIKHDISAPIVAIPDFIRRASEEVLERMPGARPLAYGHLGDGNIHFNVSQPVEADKRDFLARWDETNEAVHRIVVEFGGSISAEHGIGRLKRDILPRFKDPVALDLMRTLKSAIDPHNLLNPGVII